MECKHTEGHFNLEVLWHTEGPNCHLLTKGLSIDVRTKNEDGNKYYSMLCLKLTDTIGDPFEFEMGIFLTVVSLHLNKFYLCKSIVPLMFRD